MMKDARGKIKDFEGERERLRLRGRDLVLPII
jgi:hypothetical protein